jgi:hypothetical protein
MHVTFNYKTIKKMFFKHEIKNNSNKKYMILAPRLVAQQSWQGFSVSASWVQASACTFVTPAMSYLFAGLVGVQWVRELIVVRVS